MQSAYQNHLISGLTAMLLVRKGEWQLSSIVLQKHGFHTQMACFVHFRALISFNYESITIQPTPHYCHSSRFSINRHLKIAVYGKWLMSDTLFAAKTKPLTVKRFTYRMYSNYRKCRTETLCLTTIT